jgi:hypothetical protein
MSIIVLTSTRFKLIKPLVCDIINGGVRHTDIYQKLTNIQHAVGVDKKKKSTYDSKRSKFNALYTGERKTGSLFLGTGKGLALSYKQKY